MNAFRYQAIDLRGGAVDGVIEADDRKAALHLLGERGLFPSNLQVCPAAGENAAPVSKGKVSWSSGLFAGKGVGRKDITSFTREMSALLGAAIPIPQALGGLGEEEENPALH